MQLVVLLLFPLIVAISRLGKVSFFQNPNPSSHDRCALLCDVHDGNRGAMSPPEQLWGARKKERKKRKRENGSPPPIFCGRRTKTCVKLLLGAESSLRLPRVSPGPLLLPLLQHEKLSHAFPVAETRSGQQRGPNDRLGKTRGFARGGGKKRF